MTDPDVRLRFLGVSGFELVTSAGTRVVIDPLLAELPELGLPPSPVAVDDLAGTDVVAVTHGASDHLGQAAARRLASSCRRRAARACSTAATRPVGAGGFHSEVMTWEPGDILSTGTRGAFPIDHGGVVRCEITGFPPLENPVVRAS